MKDLITTVASILLLMIFVSQFVATQTVYSRMIQADRAVEVFRDRMKEDGRMTRENQGDLEEALKKICHCESREITIIGTETVISQGNLVYYKICYPLKGQIGAAAMLGIKESENQRQHQEEGYVVSRFRVETVTEEAPEGNG